VEKDIRVYMIQQVETLKERYKKKIGYSEENGNKLLKFLTDNPNLPDVYLPANSF
jgi:cystathionine beta-lyase/cystathionine gamma-synthase